MVFRRVGLGIIELWNFDLADAGGKHRWLCEFDDLTLCDLVYLLQFTGVSHEVWRVGRARG